MTREELYDQHRGRTMNTKYINATKLCRKHKTHLGNYMKLARFWKHVDCISRKTGIHRDDLIDIPHGRKEAVWVHPDIAVHVAAWASPAFAVFVSSVISELLRTGRAVLREQAEIAYIAAGLGDLMDDDRTPREIRQRLPFTDNPRETADV